MPVRLVVLLCLVLVGCGRSSDRVTSSGLAELIGNSTIVDLSYAYDETTVYWPTAPGFELTKEFAGDTDKGYYYAANSFRSAEHGGTHVDAPVHFARGHLTVDRIPVAQLIGPGVVVDVSSKALAGGDARDYRVSVDDLREWEARYGRIPEGTIVLLHTGFSRYWPERAQYMGTDERGEAAVAKLRFPGLAPAAARWLVTERSIAAVGLDTPSIDYGQSTMFESHRVLSEADVPALENLARLDELPATGFMVVALPMKIRGGTGAPLRAVAIVEGGGGS